MTLLFDRRVTYLGVQQCFGVVYHELTTLRQVSEGSLNKPVLALLIHDIPQVPQRKHCWILFNHDKQSYYILLGDFKKGKTKCGLSRINNALHTSTWYNEMDNYIVIISKLVLMMSFLWPQTLVSRNLPLIFNIGLLPVYINRKLTFHH